MKYAGRSSNGVASNETSTEVVVCDQDEDCVVVGQCVQSYGCSVAGLCVVAYHGNACNDGLSTTHTDTCNAQTGACAGATIVCDTPNQCQTAGTPDGSPSCPAVSKPNTATCNDNNLTTHTDVCDGAGGCAGTAVVCDTPSQCQVVGTPNGTASCPPTPKGAGELCNDGFTTTYDDQCDGSGGCGNDHRLQREPVPDPRHAERHRDLRACPEEQRRGYAMTTT